MARPSIINDELIARFCSLVRTSGSIETAIAVTGIGRASYYRWVSKVREGTGSARQVKFISAVGQVEAEIKMLLEHQLFKHGDLHWKIVAGWPARKYPHEYGRRRRMPPLEGDEPAEQEDPRVGWRKRNPRRR